MFVSDEVPTHNKIFYGFLAFFTIVVGGIGAMIATGVLQ